MVEKCTEFGKVYCVNDYDELSAIRQVHLAFCHPWVVSHCLLNIQLGVNDLSKVVMQWLKSDSSLQPSD